MNMRTPCHKDFGAFFPLFDRIRNVITTRHCGVHSTRRLVSAGFAFDSIIRTPQVSARTSFTRWDGSPNSTRLSLRSAKTKTTTKALKSHRSHMWTLRNFTNYPMALRNESWVIIVISKWVALRQSRITDWKVQQDGSLCVTLAVYVGEEGFQFRIIQAIADKLPALATQLFPHHRVVAIEWAALTRLSTRLPQVSHGQVCPCDNCLQIRQWRWVFSFC